MVEWDGVPPDAGRDGWHWVSGQYAGAAVACAFWRSEFRDWLLTGQSFASKPAEIHWRYIGPAIPPKS